MRSQTRRDDRRQHAIDILNYQTYDVLKWLTPPVGMHMTGTHDMYTVVTPTSFLWIKDKKGFPADEFLYDNDYVYMYRTEGDGDGWTNPGNVKLSGKRAIKFCRRFARDGEVWVTPAAQSIITPYVNCKPGPTFSLGEVQCEFHAPRTMDFGGDVGVVPTVQIWYRWNGDGHGVFKTMERYVIAQKFGLVRWNTSDWDAASGSYILRQESTFNKQVPGTVASVYPCVGL